MPIPEGTRVRVRTFKSGKRVRLTFSEKGRILEIKKLSPINIRANNPMALKQRKSHQRRRT